jgi:hypothetical protein
LQTSFIARRSKFTKIGIFGLKNVPSGRPRTTTKIKKESPRRALVTIMIPAALRLNVESQNAKLQNAESQNAKSQNAKSQNAKLQNAE